MIARDQLAEKLAPDSLDELLELCKVEPKDSYPPEEEEKLTTARQLRSEGKSPEEIQKALKNKSTRRNANGRRKAKAPAQAKQPEGVSLSQLRAAIAHKLPDVASLSPLMVACGLDDGARSFSEGDRDRLVQGADLLAEGKTLDEIAEQFKPADAEPSVTLLQMLETVEERGYSITARLETDMMRVCGLSYEAPSFSQREVETFCEGFQLFEAGRSLADIATHFGHSLSGQERAQLKKRHSLQTIEQNAKSTTQEKLQERAVEQAWEDTADYWTAYNDALSPGGEVYENMQKVWTDAREVLEGKQQLLEPHSPQRLPSTSVELLPNE